ncbi:MAG: hypothetical protein Q8Q42_02245 [Nanoarchaeota archaeon]|nr:hypothetical protein [Nanoarchaeota archaeon]
MKFEIKNCGSWVFFLIVFSALLLPNVYGLAVGVSPSKYTIEDALKGESYQKSMRFSTTSDENIIVDLVAYGDYKDWVKFYDIDDLSKEITQLSINANGKEFAMIVFNIPKDTPNGEYEIQVAGNKAFEEVDNDVKTGSGVELKTFAKVKIYVTGNQKLESEVRSISTRDVETGYPLRIKVDMENNGNVKSNPKIDVEIFKDGAVIDSVTKSDSYVDVGQIEIIDVEWDTSGRGVGEFSAKVKVTLEGKLIGEKLVDFNILNSGNSELEGSLGKVYDPDDVEIGKVAKISVDFKNRGNVDFTAKLTGEVMINGKLEDVIGGDEIVIGPSERENLAVYFTPLKAGNYEIKREIVYSGKKFQMDDFKFELDENGMRNTSSSGSSKLPLIIIGVVLVILVILGVRYL